MVYGCRRWRRSDWRGELREGSRTGSNALHYITLAGEINSSGILKIEKRNVLCPKCLKELDEWLKREGGPYRLPTLAVKQANQKVGNGKE